MLGSERVQAVEVAISLAHTYVRICKSSFLVSVLARAIFHNLDRGLVRMHVKDSGRGANSNPKVHENSEVFWLMTQKLRKGRSFLEKG